MINLTNKTMNSLYHDICTWNVTVRAGRTISVKFITMTFFPEYACTYSYVLVSVFIHSKIVIAIRKESIAFSTMRVSLRKFLIIGQ